MTEIEKFCKFHNACEEGVTWAMKNCPSGTMQEAWDKSPCEYLLWIATRKNVVGDRELRLFACWCVRQVWHLLTDERSKRAVEVAEKYAVGEATKEELMVARVAASDAAWAAWAAWAASDAAWDAASDAARAAASNAARAAARSAARSAQANYIRENFKPNFAIAEDS